MPSQATIRWMMPCRRARSNTRASSVGSSSGRSLGSSTSWAEGITRAAANGRRAHRGSEVTGWPRRETDCPFADSRLIAPSGSDTSLSLRFKTRSLNLATERSRPAPSHIYQTSPTELVMSRTDPIEQRLRRDRPRAPGPRAPRFGPLATPGQQGARRSPDHARCCERALRPTTRRCSWALSCAQGIRARNSRRQRPRGADAGMRGQLASWEVREGQRLRGTEDRGHVGLAGGSALPPCLDAAAATSAWR